MATSPGISGTPPPAPWRCRVDVLLWWQRAVPTAALALPPQLSAGPVLPLTVGMAVRYRESPVGRYDEVAVSPVLSLRYPLCGHVPFMAVDSAASVAAGRAVWALPKQLAAFDGEVADGAAWSARGDGWSVRCRPQVVGPRVPLGMAWGMVQVRDAGPNAGAVERSWLRLTGRGWYARAWVEADGDGPGEWLEAGRRRAVLVRDGVFTIGAPQPTGQSRR